VYNNVFQLNRRLTSLSGRLTFSFNDFYRPTEVLFKTCVAMKFVDDDDDDDDSALS